MSMLTSFRTVDPLASRRPIASTKRSYVPRPWRARRALASAAISTTYPDDADRKVPFNHQRGFQPRCANRGISRCAVAYSGLVGRTILARSLSGSPVEWCGICMPSRTLSESIVKTSLKNLDWHRLEQHLSTLVLDQACAAQLLGLLRRNGNLFQKRPAPIRSRARDAFLANVEAHFLEHLGQDWAREVNELTGLSHQIEAGYAEILRSLSATDAAKMAPEVQAASGLSWSAHAFDDMMKEFHADLLRRRRIKLSHFRVRRRDGTSFNPDGALGNLVNMATMTLLLLGYQQSWFDVDGFLFLPALPEPTDVDNDRTAATLALAASWRLWERLEQRCRYFGRGFRVIGEPMPRWVPKDAKRAIAYELITPEEGLDYYANVRLTDQLARTYHGLLQNTNLKTWASGIDGPLELPPKGYVSPEEGHSCISLSEVLGYFVLDDQERPCGLRLVEWIRGYSTLQSLAGERYRTLGLKGLCHIIPRSELRALLERVGLKNGAADLFINQASMRKTSRDLFDQPLVRMRDGSLMLFGPAIIYSEPGRVTLSAVGKQGEQLGRKGKAFEREMLRFIAGQGLAAKAFRLKIAGEEFEYDLVVPWNEYLFVFECKNRTLSAHNPAAAYYFALEMNSAVNQVTRLATALHDHADAVRDVSGIDAKNMIIVPCILSSLPYAAADARNNVHMTDVSLLKRFFSNSREPATTKRRSSATSLWLGDKPTPADFLSYLQAPSPLLALIARTRHAPFYFDLGEETAVAVTDIMDKDTPVMSLGRLFSAEYGFIERGTSRSDLNKRRLVERQAVREADRKWRKVQTRIK
ncbi:hypothetical protein [Bradyrhizobium sp. WSM471]|uniref:hypothetical protein n=1 Tax=Bradyrhizobium sp. WSM471 TaxID=319017 RepID=UPI00024D1CA2|nr:MULTISPECIES: hypothetical protein [Bradyrhizobium]EHR00986.1 hypothetical protein Bra471DRAFT_01639 [Bradyrhizobium sp. WSM471]UFW43045.1 NERD domain-containing protein [Bradyrhizobium canariense]